MPHRRRAPPSPVPVVPVLAAALLAACAEAPAAPDRPPEAASIALDDAGRGVAERLCAGCHAVAPGGASPVAAAPPLTTIGRRYPVAAIAEALAEGILVGHGDVRMPEFRLEPPEIEALIEYLETVQEP